MLTPSTPTTPTGSYTGRALCAKCGIVHWIYGECGTAQLQPSNCDSPTATAPGRWGYFVPAEPSVSYVYGWKQVRLNERLSYHHPDGSVESAEAGLTSDGATIWRILNTFAGERLRGAHVLPAFIHDAMCERARRVGGAAGLAIRQRADDLFPAMLRACGASRWSAWSKGKAVKLGTLATRIRGDWRRAGSVDGPPV